MRTHRKPAGRDRRRDITRAQLLAAAETLMEDGETFAEISIGRLAAEAGISRTTFYVYFEGKGELLQAWYEEVADDIEAASNGWWGLDGGLEAEDLQRAIERIASTYRRHAPLLAAVYDAALFDAGVADMVDALISRTEERLRAHIERGQQEGWIDPELPAAETGAWLVSLLERAQQRLTNAAEDFEMRHLVQAETDIVWNTLYAPPRRRA